MTIHHIGYLVKRLEQARGSFLALGFQAQGEPVYDAYRDVDIQFLEKDGWRVELVSPRSESSVVGKLMKSRKNSPYHLCCEAEDFDRELEALERTGFLLIDRPAPAPALGDRRVCFLMSPHAGMIEVLEGGTCTF